jgi:hypothetical protein
VYSLTLPASWYYPEMGPRTEAYAAGRLPADQQTNQPPLLRTNQLSASAGQIVSYGVTGNPLRSLAGSPSATNWATHPPLAVMQAQAQTFRNNWFTVPPPGDTPEARVRTATDELIASQYVVSTAARTGLGRIYRPEASFVYRDDAVAANSATNTSPNRIYNAGMTGTSVLGTTPFNLFGAWWNRIGTPNRPAPAQGNWLQTSVVEHYSPHGTPVQERNALNVYSTANYGYQGMLPTMVASNARYGTVAFEDFENRNAAINRPAEAHSGNRYIELNGTAPQPLLSQLLVSPELLRDGGLVKAWVRSAATPNFNVSASFNNGAVIRALTAPALVAQTGNWSLYEIPVPVTAFEGVAAGSTFSLTFSNAAAEALGVDDVRFQPVQAQATCYVYDTATLRLAAQFDDQHFGMYYQYNPEGKLVRKLIETERGLKTVQETQYNTPKTPRF